MKIAVAFVLTILILAAVGCALTQTRSDSINEDGVRERQRSFAWSIFSDQPSVSETEKSRSSAGGQHPPDPKVERTRMITRAGIGLVIVGGLLAIASFWVPVIPFAASLMIAGLGLALLIFGTFLGMIEDNAVLIIGIVVLAVAGELLGFWSNLRARWKPEAE